MNDAIRGIFALGQVNPFTQARRRAEALALGDESIASQAPWSEGEHAENPHLEPIAELAEELAPRLRRKLKAPTLEEREHYAGVVFMVLYNRYAPQQAASGGACWPSFERDFSRMFANLAPPDPATDTPAHLFACIHQIRRAFDVIFTTMVGGSASMVQLRAQTWRSIFTHDAHRYRRFLFRHMPAIPTLITGETGTGKELVARAIGLSGYIPFDPASKRFAHAPTLLPVNLSALSSELVEAELFGHKKGAFTGAVSDRVGFLGECPAGGAVFLDEIGEIEPALQVKLLRVLEARAFTPVGATETVPFRGRILAATHRNLGGNVLEGRFRSDLYYRLDADRVHTPSLASRIAEDPAELGRLVAVLAGRLINPDGSAFGDERVAALANEILIILHEERAQWDWPGNVRELAQCVRHVVVQGKVPTPLQQRSKANNWLEAASRGDLTIAELLSHYSADAHARHGSWKAAAEALGVDWRTAKSHAGG